MECINQNGDCRFRLDDESKKCLDSFHGYNCTEVQRLRTENRHLYYYKEWMQAALAKASSYKKAGRDDSMLVFLNNTRPLEIEKELAGVALMDSIKTWEGKLETAKRWIEDPTKNPPIRLDSSACPLCRVFFTLNCEGCPVSKKTGVSLCEKTPYTTVGRMQMNRCNTLKNEHNKNMFIEAIMDEIEFLKSLQPKE